MYESSNLELSTGGRAVTVEIVSRSEDAHPLAHIRSLVDDLCDGAPDAAARHAPLIRAALLQALYSFPTDEQLLEQLRYNGLYRWFVGLRGGESLWCESDYAGALEALRSDESAAALFRRAVNEARAYAALMPGRFRVDTALIEAWARTPAPSPLNGADWFRSDAARTSRLDRARAVILRRVADPKLDADAVAAELHMSRRALYLLFERCGLTPARARSARSVLTAAFACCATSAIAIARSPTLRWIMDSSISHHSRANSRCVMASLRARCCRRSRSIESSCRRGGMGRRADDPHRFHAGATDAPQHRSRRASRTGWPASS